MNALIFRLRDKLRGKGRLVLVGAIVVLTLVLSIVLDAFHPKFPRGTEISRLDDLASRLGGILMVAVVIGLIAMALVQLIKNLTSVRGLFQRNEVARYVGGSEGMASSAWDQLQIALGTASMGIRADKPGVRNLRYFFDLPLEQLAGQLGAAAELALSRPGEYEQLLRGLLNSEPQSNGEEEPDEIAIVVGAGVISPLPDDKQVPTRVLEARNHVGLMLQRAIDSMQIIIGHRWRWFIRTLAIATALVLTILGTQYAGMRGMDRAAAVVISTMLGGLFAWTSRDVASAIERIRR